MCGHVISNVFNPNKHFFSSVLSNHRAYAPGGIISIFWGVILLFGWGNKIVDIAHLVSVFVQEFIFIVNKENKVNY